MNLLVVGGASTGGHPSVESDLDLTPKTGGAGGLGGAGGALGTDDLGKCACNPR